MIAREIEVVSLPANDWRFIGPSDSMANFLQTARRSIIDAMSMNFEVGKAKLYGTVYVPYGSQNPRCRR
jgi:hypothetical protein